MNGRYLIVEDEAQIRTLVAKVLEQKGIQTTCAESSQDALKIMREQGHPSLILTDFNMPYETGIDFILAAQQLLGYAGPVVFMTGNASDLRLAAKKQSVPVDYLISKPFDNHQLYQTLVKALTGTKQIPSFPLETSYAS